MARTSSPLELFHFMNMKNGRIDWSVTRPSRQQFRRTAQIRRAVYRMARLSAREVVLDAGCGDGSVGLEVAERTGRVVLAFDLMPPAPVPGKLATARADAHDLPLGDSIADAVCFNFVLLWLRDPLRALREARRVLKPGGVVMILSEPDFGARVEVPDAGLGRAIAEVVRSAGGRPDAGRHIGGWLREAGFQPHLKVTACDPEGAVDPSEIQAERDFLASFGIRLEIEKPPRVHLPLTFGWGQA